MKDRSAFTENEIEARRRLVTVAERMLSGQLSFFEGSVQVLWLRGQVGGIADRDTDFDAFVVIASETDHLPLEAQRPLWAAESLKRLQPEIDAVQVWASSFAPEACGSLVARFKEG